MAALICAASPAPAETPAPEHDPHSAAGALRLVFRNAATPLPDNAACRGVTGTPGSGPALGDWMAAILAALPPAPGRSGIAAGCEGPPEALRCAVHVSRRAGEEVWSWGVRFRADGTTGVIDRASLICDATG